MWHNQFCKVKEQNGNDKGFTLLEVLIAMVVLAIGILAVARMQTNAIRGNVSANDLTEAATHAQNRIESFVVLPYDDLANPNDPLDDVDHDGTGEDANYDGIDDNGGDFGLNDDTVATADGNATSADGKYNIFWNTAVNIPITNNKTIRVIVKWTQGNRDRRISMDYIKADTI